MSKPDEGSAAMGRNRRSILIVAGEASADRYGARLAERLSVCGGGGLRFFGAGGDRMLQAGVELVGHIRDLASIGPLEAVHNLGKYYSLYRELLRTCRRRRPEVAVLLDFPDFNLRLARKLKQQGIRVIYYISPQIWAWRRGRVRIVRRHVDKMLVILPFEADYYRGEGVDVEFVGHPLLEDFRPKYDRIPFLSGLGCDPGLRTIALLPGSRRREVDYILPVLVGAARRVLRTMPAQFLISAAPGIEPERIRRITSAVLGGKDEDRFRITAAESRDLLANSDFGFVKSGTSTLEAALVGTPFLIVYRISSLSWRAGNILVSSPYKGLVNLVAGEEIVPEYLQGDATPENLSQAALDFLSSPEKAAAMKLRLAAVREKLGSRCATDATAAIVEQYLQ